MEHTTIELLGFIAFFALLYSFSDAWHDEKIIRQEKKWHVVDAGIKGLVSFFIGFIVWWFTFDWLLGCISGLTILLIRAGTFNWVLNKLMEWPNKTKKKEGLDRVPTWFWWILIIGVGVFVYLKYL